MPRFNLSLLGPFQAMLDGIPIAGFESNKVRGLLAYLAVESNRPHPREKLAGLFWSEIPNQTALTNLRSALSNLRQLVDDAHQRPTHFLVSRETIQFNIHSDALIDVVKFTSLYSCGKSRISPGGETTAGIHDLETAASQYRGSFLDGFSIGDSPEFEAWELLKREQLGRDVIWALRHLAEYYEQGGMYEQAQSFAWRQVELEPWQEEGYQQLMRSLALNGQRSEALAQYEVCQNLLMTELGVEPSTETTRLYEAIRDGELDESKGIQPLAHLTPSPGKSPFKGLPYFEEADAAIFFGREKLVNRLVGHLEEMVSAFMPDEVTAGVRLLTVVGASGSGKSSLLRAGLVPAIRQPGIIRDGSLLQPEGIAWKVYLITPTADPLSSLASCLAPQGDSALAAEMTDNPRALYHFTRRLRNSHPNDSLSQPHLLLIIDQFEELFTLCHTEAERTAFIENLLSAAGEDGACTVVIALRADFYSQCAGYPSLRQAVSRHQEYIGPMSLEDLRQAIEAPARGGGWEIEAGLVDLILRDVGEEPGALPLLSHALLETWHRRKGRVMTLAGYSEAGGVHKAIAQTADGFYSNLSPEQQLLTRRILLRLTELGEGNLDTRRRVSLDELISSPQDSAMIAELLEGLAGARLIALSNDSAEIAHEALIREWPALREWLSENRDELRLHRHLTQAAQAWDELNREPGELYRGARLAQALEWTAQGEQTQVLNALECNFLRASRELAELEENERRLQQQRELQAALRLAESEKLRAEDGARTASRLRQRAFYLAGALILAVILAIVALSFGSQARSSASHNATLAVQNAYNASLAQTQEADAQYQARVAEVNGLIEAVSANLEKNPELSLLLGLRAAELAEGAGMPLPERLMEVLHKAVQNSRVLLTLTGSGGETYGIAYSPDGMHLATGYKDGTVKVWDAHNGQETMTLNGHTDEIYTIAFSPDGAYLATGSDDRSARLWDAFSGKLIFTFSYLEGVDSVSFSPDGMRLAASSWDGMSAVWDVTTGVELLRLKDAGTNIKYSPDGSILATNPIAGGTAIWDAFSGEMRESITLGGSALAFSPDGRLLAVSQGAQVSLWDMETHTEGLSFPVSGPLVTSLDFSTDGTLLAIAGQDGTASLWDVQSGQEMLSLNGHAGAVNEVALSPECTSPPHLPYTTCSRYLATTSRDGTARIWDIAPSGSHELLTLPGLAGQIDQSGDYLSVLDISSPASLEFSTWAVKRSGGGNQVSRVSLDGLTFPLLDGVFSPDGLKMAVLEGDGRLSEWDSSSGQKILTFTLPDSSETYLGMDYIQLDTGASLRIATSSTEGAITVWDVERGEPLTMLSGSNAHPVAVSFSPDGSRLGVGYGNASVRIWDILSGQVLHELLGHSMVVTSVAFSPDGSLLGTGSLDRTAKVWEVGTGSLLYTLSGHTGTVMWLAFSPDGSRLVTSGYDGRVKLWDVSDGRAGGQELYELTGHDGFVNSIEFSPDGRRLSLGSTFDWSVRLYTLQAEELVQLARARLTRAWTPEECKRYLRSENCPALQP